MPRSRPAGPLLAREWYFVAAAFDPERRRVLLIQEPQKAYARDESPAQREVIAEVAPGEAAAPLTFAARLDPASAGAKASAHFNGKIDSPRLYRRALPAALLRLTIDQPAAPAYGADLVGAWDFALDMSSDRIRDRSPNRLDGRLVNLPTRAMKGWNWDASELDWRRAPGQYGAIHFHDDDLYDAGWQTDVVFEVPGHLRSGLYAARLQDGDEVERIPFFVLPPRGKATADTLFLIPTASYMAYANERLGYDSDLAEVASGHVPAMGREDLFLATHREYGYSFYETHSDGSGVSVSSRLRPILNMRPGHTSSWIGPAGAGSLAIQRRSPYQRLARGGGPSLRCGDRRGAACGGAGAAAALPGGDHRDPSRILLDRDVGRGAGLSRSRRPADVSRRQRLLLAHRLPSRASRRHRAAARRGRGARLVRASPANISCPSPANMAGSGGATAVRPRR